jgi:ApaG protein
VESQTTPSGPIYREQTLFQTPEDPEGWVEIQVVPEYMSEESKKSGYSIYAYHVTVANHGRVKVQLKSRYWLITDGKGTKREVVGDGVIGVQPWIEPGHSFSYSSFSPLPTPTGNMRGSYQFMTEAGTQFKAKIPVFFLRQ